MAMTRKTNFKNTVTKALNSSMKFIFQYRFIILAFGLILFAGADSVAQPPPPGGGSGPPCWPPPCIPIDGGLSWLIVAGVAYSAKKSFDFKKKN